VGGLKNTGAKRVAGGMLEEEDQEEELEKEVHQQASSNRQSWLHQRRSLPKHMTQ
jgi:hypothetical protein